MQNILTGNITLSKDIENMPIGGLTSRKLRVELLDENKSDSGWISELEIVGDLPWCKEQSRQVKVRIMSVEFRKYVESSFPDLLVKYGKSVVGFLRFERTDQR